MKNKKYFFMVSIFVLFGSLTFLLSAFLISNFYLRGLNQSYEMLEKQNSEITKQYINNNYAFT